MKLNEELGSDVSHTTLGLQHRWKVWRWKMPPSKSSTANYCFKVDNLQSAKDYYEQSLMLELKKNQELQEYVRLLEQRRQQPPIQKDRVRVTAPNFSSSSFPVSSPSLDVKQKANHRNCDSHQEVLDLKEQLEALRCQTEIYEAEYQTEHSNHKHTLQDNQRLRRKRQEMRQQLDLLQEQLKVYEDDFRRERSDKQMLQRLLLKKTAPNKDPVLVHRCNNELQPEGSDKRHRLQPESNTTRSVPKHTNRSKGLRENKNPK
ncbi:TNFAIP3-interacting protein 1 [Syngnathus acus]|uniref:TNFAIP3-interacting protein 1 n=1 Tax=Syngnathus acus TaxID=161584 RepID=UPI001885D503|nr:TNFAIP3-interacting protein 1 [Syngnathus acus]